MGYMCYLRLLVQNNSIKINLRFSRADLKWESSLRCCFASIYTITWCTLSFLEPWVFEASSLLEWQLTVVNRWWQYRFHAVEIMSDESRDFCLYPCFSKQWSLSTRLSNRCQGEEECQSFATGQCKMCFAFIPIFRHAWPVSCWPKNLPPWTKLCWNVLTNPYQYRILLSRFNWLFL